MCRTHFLQSSTSPTEHDGTPETPPFIADNLQAVLRMFSPELVQQSVDDAASSATTADDLQAVLRVLSGEPVPRTDMSEYAGMYS